MTTNPRLLPAPCWTIFRYFLNDNLWEVSLTLGNTTLYLPILFESRDEASKYINSAYFDFIDTRFCNCKDYFEGDKIND